MLVEAFTVADGSNGKRFVQIPAYPHNKLTGVLPSCGWLGKRGSVPFANIDPFFDSPAEFPIDLGLLVAMDAPEHEPGARSDIAMVFFRPLDNLEISITGFHPVTSRSAC